MEYWTQFYMVVAAQLVFFLLVAYWKDEFDEKLFAIVFKGMGLGLLFGVPFDLIFGLLFGIFDYRIDLSLQFLFMNGVLSYGLLFATVLLCQQSNYIQLYLWTILLGAYYEWANFFYPVWAWTFDGVFAVKAAMVIFAGYYILALMMMAFATLVTHVRFKVFDFTQKEV